MKNGVNTEATPKTRLAGRSTGPGSAWRKAKPAPRRTIPSAASASGMYSVVKIAEKADEKAVQRMTRTKISQTWFASQTGPIDRSIWARTRPRPFPRARKQVPETGAEVGPAEDRVERDAEPEDRRADIRLAHGLAPDPASAGGP